MDPNIPTDDSHEQRMLAAIVFTDVVGFSKLAAQNEARVYAALQRDMGVISNLCQAHSGQVVNTMGDGMLLRFTSAVDAMSCAVEIQRTLYAQLQSLRLPDVLHHRIGVHLGDIIVNGDNVFGDGVNIAARLQVEAKPDGICFSKTVHEVIKGKLQIDSHYLAPRQLKNIGRLELWEVPPIDEARKVAIAALATAPLAADLEPTGARGYKAIGLVIAALVCVGAVVFFVRIASHKLPPVAPSGTVMTDKNAKVRGMAPGLNDPKEGDTAGSTDAPTKTKPTGDDTPALGVLQARLETMKARYSFDEISAFLAGDGKTIPNAEALSQAFADLSEMKRWMDSEVNSATASNKISTTMPIDGTPTQVGIYRDASGIGYEVETLNGTTSWLFEALNPLDIEAIAQALVEHPITNPQPKAQGWISEFQAQYGSPSS